MLGSLLSKQNIIFDLDGTILDLRQSSRRTRLEAIKSFYGDNIPKTLTKRKMVKAIGYQN